ncbi:hypothetical protein Hdeb2414_s0016g00490971 [Helianthus debilis subsp. tardiflorus]
MQKRQSHRSVYSQLGGVPSSTRVVVNAKIRKILQILIVRIRFCTRGRAQRTWGVWSLMQTIAINEERES